MEKFGEFLKNHRLEVTLLFIITVISQLQTALLDKWIWIIISCVIIAYGTIQEFVSRKREKLKECVEDLDLLVEEFGKFFHHPYYAIMPNPFNEEPGLWKYYVDSFFEIYGSWVSLFKNRFKESKGKLDFQKLLGFWTEFCSIVGNYRYYAQSFRALASTKEHATNVPGHIKEQFNTDFLEEFNHVLLRKIDEYATKFERESGNEVPSKKIKPLKPITTKLP